jgi:hypothetical protein
MYDERRHAGLPASLLRTDRPNRRALLRTAGTVGLAGSIGATARRPSAAVQEGGGAIIRSRSRAAVMEEILAAYPLRRGRTRGRLGHLRQPRTHGPLP